MLDFSRIFPPEYPFDLKKGQHATSVFYNLFRPRFVQQYTKPLCSDGLTGFVNSDPNRDSMAISLIL